MKKIFWTLVISMSALAGTAQQLPLYSQYFFNPFLFNPGFTGLNEGTNAFLIHRSQWKDIPGAPMTNVLSIDGKLNDPKFGLGLTVYQDVTDMMERLGVGASYSYKIKIAEDHHILAGVTLGITDNNFDFSRAMVQDQNDPFLFGDKRRKVNFDANLGVVYQWKEDLFVGFSAPQLLGNDVRYISNESNAFYHLSRHYLGFAKYSFYISEANLIKCTPSAAVRVVMGAPVQFDVNASVDWKNFLWGGFSYRHGYAVGAHIGVKVNKSLTAGYYYDYVTSGIGSYSGGGHELMLGYTFGGKKEEKMEEVKKDNTNLMVDSVLLSLKKTDAQQKEEIEQLKKEVEELKNRKDAPVPPQDPNKTSDTTGMIRKEKTKDFKDETGQLVQKGYYVVINAFKSEANAKVEKEKWIKKGYQTCQFLFNQNRGLFYVFVLTTPSSEAALSELKEVKGMGAPDSWIYELQ